VDGKPDLVTANINASTVSVLQGNGDGTFQTKLDYGTGDAPYSVAIGDVSGDGKPDLVTANLNAGVSVLLGNGDGTFQTKVDYATGGSPQSVAIGDVSGDGKPDLVTANSIGTTVSVLLGNGDGTFQTKVDHATGGSQSVAIGDERRRKAGSRDGERQRRRRVGPLGEWGRRSRRRWITGRLFRLVAIRTRAGTEAGSPQRRTTPVPCRSLRNARHAQTKVDYGRGWSFHPDRGRERDGKPPRDGER
jgi:hypothetical protein